MPPDLALSSTLTGSNYPCLELIFMVPKVFEPLRFDCILPFIYLRSETVDDSFARIVRLEIINRKRKACRVDHKF